MREGYKNTEVGVIPEDWEVKKLEEIATIIMGQSPSSDSYNESRDGLPFFQGNSEFGRMFPTVKKWCNEPLKIAKPLDILISVRAPVGAVNINIEESCIGRGLGAVRSHQNIDYRYLYYTLIESEKVLNSSAQGSTFTAINSGDLKNLKIKVPKLKEQEKIAEILSTVDSQIDNTENLIEKSKELKKGLMQKLLTKGIGHSEFKKTAVGDIPVDWQIEKIANVTNLIKSGLSRKLSDENIGIPCLRSNNIKESKLTLVDLKYWYLIDNKGANLNDYILDSGDIIMNFINSPSQIGKGCIFNKENLDCIYSTNLLRIKLDEEKMLTKFFYYYTQTERYKKEIMLITKPAVNQASFTTTEFKEIKFPVPTIKEQNRIVDILSSVDKKIDEYENKKQKLEDVKKGLMQQLLTGKIRITI